MRRIETQEQAMMHYCKAVIVKYVDMYKLTSLDDTKRYLLSMGFNATEYNEAIGDLLVNTIKVNLHCVPANLEIA